MQTISEVETRDPRGAPESGGTAAEPGALAPSEPATVLYGERYELLSLVGAGAYGSVYRAHDNELEEVVALKVLRQEHLLQPGALARFRKEVRLARRVSHPNIARTYDIGRHQGERFLTMEFIDGQPLTRLCPLGAPEPALLPIRVVLQIAAQLCAGLEALHAAGIVHQDMKTDNVLVSREGRVVITDFGIASALSDPDPERDAQAALSGTPAYMAPEQVRGYGKIDTRADLYALGVMLFQMLTGGLPFAGPTGLAMALARLFEEPLDPRARRPQLPEALAALIGRCLMRRPEDRFQRAGALAEALRAELPAGPELPEFLATQDAARRGAAPSKTIDLARELDELLEWATQDRTLDVATTAPEPLPLPDLAESRQLPIAVLLFRAVEGGADDYLLHGLTEELIHRLSESERLSVTGFGVVRSLQQGPREPDRLGRQLQVKVVLDGSLALKGAGMQAVVCLLDVDSRLQFAVRCFERADRNILELAAELARAVSELLTVQLGERRSPLAEDPESVELYLRARHQLHRMSPEGARAGVALLEQALARRPEEPLLLTGYARALARHFFFFSEPSAEQVLAAAERACRAAPWAPEPYLALAGIQLNQMQGLAAAQSMRRAGLADPRSAEAHESIGMLLNETGPAEAALRHLQLSLLLDNSVPYVRMLLGRCSLLSGQLDAALDLLAIASYGPADLPLALIAQVRALCWIQDRARAQSLLQDPVLAAGEKQFLRRQLACVLGDRSVTLAEYLPPHMSQRGGSPRRRVSCEQLVVEYHCLREELQPALESLGRAVENGLIDLVWLDGCPLLAPLRSRTEYAALRGRVWERAAAIRRVLGFGPMEP